MTTTTEVKQRLNQLDTFLAKGRDLRDRLVKALEPGEIVQAANVASRYTGSSRRLSEDEYLGIVEMLKAKGPDGQPRYTIQEITNAYLVTRPTIYTIRDKECPNLYKRPRYLGQFGRHKAA